MKRLSVGRVSVGLADQAVASASSFVLAVLVARHADGAAFGGFVLAWTAYWLVLGSVRALVCEPLLIRYSGQPPRRWRAVAAAAAGTAFVIGLGAAAACGLAGLFVPPDVGRWLLAVAVFLPGLLVHDVWRVASFARSRGQDALVLDLVWLAAFVAAAGLVEAGTVSAGPTALALWGACGCLAAGVGSVWFRCAARPAAAWRWWRHTRALGGRLLPEFVALGAASQAAAVVVAAVAGLAAAASLRGAQVLLGPLNVVFSGLALVTIPHGASLARISPQRVVALARRAAVVCAATALTTGAVIGLLPESVGSALLGQIWPLARSVLGPSTVAVALSGVVVGATIGLRSLADARSSLRARLVVAPITVAGVAAGAAFGATGAAVGLAAANLLAACIWWRALLAAPALREARAGLTCGVADPQATRGGVRALAAD
jgi:hypothetical protein